MELNDLAIFQCVATVGSMSKAARIMGYAQSNVTERIRLLEQELTVRLFKRTNRGVILLPEGERLVEYATVILTQVDEIQKHFKKLPIKIGCTQTIASSYFNLTAVINHQPEIELLIDSAVKLEAMYRSNELDVLITNKMTSLTNDILFNEDIGWLSALGSQEVYLISRDKECPYRKMMLSLINPLTCKIVEVDSIYLMIDLIKKGAGRSLLPECVFQERQNQSLLFTIIERQVPIYIAGNAIYTKQVRSFLE
ncbi:LysR family transcriptional regulator [Enterococcus caccae]|uniref:LysR family transcriptional regulator n=1 Tax=Enterococcus caccae TaxID=317735 RepID=UPI0003A3AE7F|nr:LysR family transcriptional regulator [Enterococcus caccae]